MAQITIRDLATNEDIVIPPEGYIFGRVGGDADIQLEDNTISRRQGRVSLKGGMWLFETLAVPQGTRPPRPVQLQDGSTFAIGAAEFEVVQVELDQEEEEFDAGAQTIAPGKGNVKPAAPAARKAPPAPSNAKTAAAAPAPKKPAQSAARSAAAAGAGAADDNEPFRFDPKALIAGAAKGAAYYMLNVPKLLVNPVGTVKKTIEEQPNEPLGQMGLVGYALPALLATAFLSSWATGIALLIGPGHTFSLMSFIPIVPAISAIIGAIVTGFVFHPVMKWIINFLKGESDARSRSNYFLQLMTVNIVLAVPSALGLILAALPVPFIGLLGPLLSVVASLAAIYVYYQWFAFFKVVDWFKKVLLVLGAISVIFAVIGFVTGVIGTIRSFGSGGGTVAAADVGDAPETDLGEMPTDPEELKAWTLKRQAALMAKAQADQKKAMDAVKAAQDQANVAVKQAEDDAKEDTKAPPPERTEKVEKVEKVEKPNVVASPEPTREPVRDTPPAPVKEDTKVAPVAASSAYGAFARRRDAIEKTLEADPTLLQKSAELQSLYAEYLDEAYELDKKYGKETQKKPERRLLNQRLRDAELYQKTGKTVDQLAGKLGIK